MSSKLLGLQWRWACVQCTACTPYWIARVVLVTHDFVTKEQADGIAMASGV